VINKMIGSVEHVPKDVADKLRASGAGTTRSAQPSPTKGGPSTLSGSSYASMPSSSLYQISIPDGLESRTYGSLYRLLSRRKQIPLGILRGVFSNTKSGPKANKMPYVFTNPPKDTELFTCDKVFVLSQTPVGTSRVLKVRYALYAVSRPHRVRLQLTPLDTTMQDETKEMQMYSSLRTRKKTTEDIIHMMGGLKDELKRLDVKSGNVDTRVTILSEEINAKFDVLFRALNINPNGGFSVPAGQSPHLVRGKTMRPGSAATDRLPTTKSMSIEAFANYNKQEASRQNSTRGRLLSDDDLGSGGGSRPTSAGGGRPALQRARSISNVSAGSAGGGGRPLSAQRARRGSGEGPSMSSYGRTRDGREVSRVGFF
jgi:hypothetical protein